MATGELTKRKEYLTSCGHFDDYVEVSDWQPNSGEEGKETLLSASQQVCFVITDVKRRTSFDGNLLFSPFPFPPILALKVFRQLEDKGHKLDMSN